MATQADVRRIAMSLPLVEEAGNDFAFAVPNKGKLKGFAWVWKERVVPKKPRVPNPTVLAVRVANLGQRDLMLSAEPVKFFTEPHYAGFPAVLVRLKEVSVADLKMLLAEGWRCMAPADLAAGARHSTRGRATSRGTATGALKERKNRTPSPERRGARSSKSGKTTVRSQTAKPARKPRRTS
jgi:hypothetical protein